MPEVEVLVFSFLISLTLVVRGQGLQHKGPKRGYFLSLTSECGGST